MLSSVKIKFNTTVSFFLLLIVSSCGGAHPGTSRSLEGFWELESVTTNLNSNPVTRLTNETHIIEIRSDNKVISMGNESQNSKVISVGAEQFVEQNGSKQYQVIKLDSNHLKILEVGVNDEFSIYKRIDQNAANIKISNAKVIENESDNANDINHEVNKEADKAEADESKGESKSMGLIFENIYTVEMKAIDENGKLDSSVHIASQADLRISDQTIELKMFNDENQIVASFDGKLIKLEGNNLIMDIHGNFTGAINGINVQYFISETQVIEKDGIIDVTLKNSDFFGTKKFNLKLRRKEQ